MINLLSRGKPPIVSFFCFLISATSLPASAQSDLFSAIKSNDVAAVEQAIVAGADVNDKGKKGFTPVHLAASRGHVDIVEVLLKHKAKPDERGVRDTTPLYLAARGGHTPVVELLINSGADVNKITAKHKRKEWPRNAPINDQTDGKWSPLNVAAYYGHTDVVKLLIKSGADVNHRPYRGGTPLYSAALNGHVDVVRILLEEGAQVKKKTNLYLTKKNKKKTDLRGYEDWTPLQAAVINPNYKTSFEIAKLLVKADARSLKFSIFTPSAAHLAARRGRVEMIELFLNHGFKIEKTSRLKINENGLYEPGSGTRGTILSAASRYGYIELVEYMIKKGSKIEVGHAYENLTPLMMAVEQGYPEIASLLLKNGAKVNRQTVYADKYGNSIPASPLYAAADRGHLEILKMLIEAGAELDQFVYSHGNYDHKWSPIIAAANNGHADVVETLINAGAKVNYWGKSGETALHRAARNGHYETANLLLANGAKVNETDYDGATPMTVAMERGQKKVAILLKQNGGRAPRRSTGSSGGGFGDTLFKAALLGVVANEIGNTNVAGDVKAQVFSDFASDVLTDGETNKLQEGLIESERKKAESTRRFNESMANDRANMKKNTEEWNRKNQERFARGQGGVSGTTAPVDTRTRSPEIQTGAASPKPQRVYQNAVGQEFTTSGSQTETADESVQVAKNTTQQEVQKEQVWEALAVCWPNKLKKGWWKCDGPSQNLFGHDYELGKALELVGCVTARNSANEASSESQVIYCDRPLKTHDRDVREIHKAELAGKSGGRQWYTCVKGKTRNQENCDLGSGGAFKGY